MSVTFCLQIILYVALWSSFTSSEFRQTDRHTHNCWSVLSKTLNHKGSYEHNGIRVSFHYSKIMYVNTKDSILNNDFRKLYLWVFQENKHAFGRSLVSYTYVGQSYIIPLLTLCLKPWAFLKRVSVSETDQSFKTCKKSYAQRNNKLKIVLSWPNPITSQALQPPP